jgi:polysaccharide export outer membrane protein
MGYSTKCVSFLPMTVIVSVGLACFPETTTAGDEASSVETSLGEYLLGAQDQLAIRVADLEETPNAPLRIDPAGNIDLPLIGPIHAAGLTISELRTQLREKFRKYVLDPVVNVTVVEFHSQPVTVVGSVHSPGVHQIEGPKRLLEVISIAGGLKDDAGSKVTITRELSSGPLPLADARTDVGGRFSVGEIELAGLISGRNPSKNIIIRPHDVVSVTAAELIYVLGEVKKPGGFTLPHSHATVSALEAVAMANGLEKTARPKHARILRVVGDGKNRATLRTDLSRIIDGKSPDVPLQANDILLIPNNIPRAAAVRGIEAAIQMGTGILIYRGLTGF